MGHYGVQNQSPFVTSNVFGRLFGSLPRRTVVGAWPEFSGSPKGGRGDGQVPTSASEPGLQ